jgi:hypothetical protein
MDFKKLGIDSITLPVGLRFSLTDGIFPTPNRESIRYTQEAKTIILKRLSQAANYFVEKYNESIKETDDVRRIVEYFNSDNRFLVFNSNKWDVHPLSKYSTFKLAEPKFKGAVLLEPSRIAKLQDYILGEYEAKFIVNRKVIRDAKGYSSLTSLRNLKDRKIYVYESDKLSQLKKDYIKSLQAGVFEDSYVFKKVKSFKLRGKLGEYNNYHNILKLRDHPKDQWRQLIQEFQLVVKSLVDTFISLDTIDIPQTFIDSRKKVKVSATGAPGVRRIKLKGEIVCKQAQHLERWVNDKSCKWVSEIYDLSTFHKNKFVLVYARQEDAMLLDQWFKPSRGHNIELATFSDRELKIVDGLKLHNLMPFNKFMEGKNKMFQRIASSCMIDQLRDEYRAVFSNRQHLQNVSTDLYNKVEILENYYKKHFRDIMSDAARDAIAAHATEVNQFDPEIHDTYKQVKTICERLSFLHPILDSMSSYTSRNTQKITEAIVDLFKYHKHKVDLKHYQIKLNDEVELETPITEEVLNDIL